MTGVAHGLLASLANGIVNLDGDTNDDSASFSIGWVFKADGRVLRHTDYVEAGQVDAATDWIIPNDAAQLQPYEIRCTVNSGTINSGLSAGVWYSLDTDRTYYDDTTGLQNYTIEIRLGSTILASGTYIGNPS